MATHAERMGYGSSNKQAPKPAAIPVTRDQRGERVYPKALPNGGSIALAVGSTFDRLEMPVRDDEEQLAQLQADRCAVTRVFEERGVSFEDAAAMLSTYLDHATTRRSPEALAQRWPNEWERIRLAAGSTEAAERVLANANELYKAIATVAPSFAASVKASGAAESARMIQAAAKYPALPEPPPAAE